MTDNPEFVDLFQELDGMVNAFDAEGAGPLRKGEQPFSWAVVETLALPLADAVPDLRVGIWLLRAELARAGLSGLAKGLSRLAQWMELPANELHPLPEAGEPSRELHAVLLRWLTTPAFISAVREAPVGTQVQLSVGELLDSTDGPGVLAALGTFPHEQVLSALTEAIEAVRRIELVLVTQAGDADVSLGHLGETLSGALQALNSAVAPESAQPAPHELVGTEVAPAKVAAPPAASTRGPTASRADAETALEDLIQYFRQHEPGHPAPIFLKRIQRMLGASFEDLMKELYPDANQLVAKIQRPTTS